MPSYLSPATRTGSPATWTRGKLMKAMICRAKENYFQLLFQPENMIDIDS
jgi:hypothetical protein